MRLVLVACGLRGQTDVPLARVDIGAQGVVDPEARFRVDVAGPHLAGLDAEDEDAGGGGDASLAELESYRKLAAGLKAFVTAHRGDPSLADLEALAEGAAAPARAASQSSGASRPASTAEAPRASAERAAPAPALEFALAGSVPTKAAARRPAKAPLEQPRADFAAVQPRAAFAPLIHTRVPAGAHGDGTVSGPMLPPPGWNGTADGNPSAQDWREARAGMGLNAETDVEQRARQDVGTWYAAPPEEAFADGRCTRSEPCLLHEVLSKLRFRERWTIASQGRERLAVDVQLRPGEYKVRETVALPAGIRLRAAEGASATNRPVVECEEAGTPFAALSVMPHEDPDFPATVIEGVKLSCHEGLVVEERARATLVDCSILATLDGVRVWPSARLVLDRTTVQAKHDGIRAGCRCRQARRAADGGLLAPSQLRKMNYDGVAVELRNGSRVAAAQDGVVLKGKDVSVTISESAVVAGEDAVVVGDGGRCDVRSATLEAGEDAVALHDHGTARVVKCDIKGPENRPTQVYGERQYAGGLDRPLGHVFAVNSRGPGVSYVAKLEHAVGVLEGHSPPLEGGRRRLQFEHAEDASKPAGAAVLAFLLGLL